MPHVPSSLSPYEELRESEFRLTSLRQLVCDLLKTNQVLREALQQATTTRPARKPVSSLE